MIEIKVTDAVKNGEKGKDIHMKIEGPKLECTAEILQVLINFIKENLNTSERFAFIATLIEST